MYHRAPCSKKLTAILGAFVMSPSFTARKSDGSFVCVEFPLPVYFFDFKIRRTEQKLMFTRIICFRTLFSLPWSSMHAPRCSTGANFALNYILIQVRDRGFITLFTGFLVMALVFLFESYILFWCR